MERAGDMGTPPAREEHDGKDRFTEKVEEKESRKLRARRKGKHEVWFGLGMFGLIGWAVAIPTILGIVIGIWIDSRWPGRFSWTLMFLVFGVIIGCLNAWFWVSREREEIEKEQRDEEET